MKKQILFIHSARAQGPHEGSDDLVAHLQDALGAEYEVLYPKMPDLENPEYEPWKKQLEKELAALDDEVILVGHSLGSSVLLKYLSEKKYKKPIAGIFLIASPYWGGDEDWQVDEYTLREDFASKLPRIRRIFLYHSRDDEIVPFAHLALYAQALPQATVRELDGYGHVFNKKFPELVDDIKSL